MLVAIMSSGWAGGIYVILIVHKRILRSFGNLI